MGPGQSCSKLLKSNSKWLKSNSKLLKSNSKLLKSNAKLLKIFWILKKSIGAPGQSCSILLNFAQKISKSQKNAKQCKKMQNNANKVKICVVTCLSFGYVWAVVVACCECHLYFIFSLFFIKVTQNEKRACHFVVVACRQCDSAFPQSIFLQWSVCQSLRKFAQKFRKVKNNKTKWRNKSVGWCCGLLCILERDCAFP